MLHFVTVTAFSCQQIRTVMHGGAARFRPQCTRKVLARTP